MDAGHIGHIGRTGLAGHTGLAEQKNVVACDVFIREISPPDSNAKLYEHTDRICRVVAKVVKLWTSKSGDKRFVKGKALARGSIGLIDFDSYSFLGKGFQLGPLSIPAVDPCTLKVGDFVFGIVHWMDTTVSTVSTRPKCAFSRCTRSNALQSVVESIHSSQFFVDSYAAYAPEFAICAALLLGKYIYVLLNQHTVTDIRRTVLELSIFCQSGRIWRQFDRCLKEYCPTEYAGAGPGTASSCTGHHIEYRSIAAFCQLRSEQTKKVAEMLSKPLVDNCV